MFTSYSFSRQISSLILLFLLCFSLYSANSFSMESPIIIAQGESKSSGNAMLSAVEGGTDFKGMTKKQVIDSYGEPFSKDTNPVKGRYDEKWTYSCETHNGLTYDCVFLYLMGDRVVNVESF